MQSVSAVMKLPLFFLLAGCATLPLPDDAPAARAEVEVHGHVSSSCPTPAPLKEEPVKLWSAGDLEALDVTRTGADGEFVFKIETAASNLPSLLIEARGVRTRATPQRAGTLVAELVLPCEG